MNKLNLLFRHLFHFFFVFVSFCSRNEHFFPIPSYLQDLILFVLFPFFDLAFVWFYVFNRIVKICDLILRLFLSLLSLVIVIKVLACVFKTSMRKEGMKREKERMLISHKNSIQIHKLFNNMKKNQFVQETKIRKQIAQNQCDEFNRLPYYTISFSAAADSILFFFIKCYWESFCRCYAYSVQLKIEALDEYSSELNSNSLVNTRAHCCLVYIVI